MQNTENFSLKVYDGEDLFNPLTVENVNMNAIDTQMKKNENHAVGDATELTSGTVHAITRLTPDAPMLRFTATSRFTVGDTFTVDGVQVSALTVSGEQLPDGAYIIGSEVLAYLKGTLLTVFTSQGTLATAKNALKLGGNDPEYYATASAVQTAQETATAAGNLANEVNNSLGSLCGYPDYANGVSYKDTALNPNVAPSNGWLYIMCQANGGLYGIYINDTILYVQGGATQNVASSLFIPVKKGDIFKAHGIPSELTFFPNR